MPENLNDTFGSYLLQAVNLGYLLDLSFSHHMVHPLRQVYKFFYLDVHPVRNPEVFHKSFFMILPFENFETCGNEKNGKLKIRCNVFFFSIYCKGHFPISGSTTHFMS